MVPSFPRKRESVPARAWTAWRHGRAAPHAASRHSPPLVRPAGTALPAGATPGPVKLALTVDVVGDAVQHGGPALCRDLAGPDLDRIAVDEGRHAFLAPLRVVPAPLRHSLQQFRRRFVVRHLVRRSLVRDALPYARGSTSSTRWRSRSRFTDASPCQVSPCPRPCGRP